jgi:hypothetical protein
MGLIIFGLGGANFYLMLFNRPARQGLHDLVAKSYVVHAQPEGVVAPRSIWRGHWVILGAYVLLLTIFPVLVVPRILEKGSFLRMMEDSKRVYGIQGVQNVAVREVKVFHPGEQPADRIFSIEVNWAGPQGDEEAVADEIGKEVLLNDKEISGYSRFRIVITRGYDLGIGSRWYSKAFAHTPDEWRQRLL